MSNLLVYLPLTAALIAVLGALLVAWLNNRWAERPRKLDLYKVVYPEKVRAARALTDLAASLFDKAGRYWSQGRVHDAEVVKELRGDADCLYALAIAHEWLLGGRVCDQARILVSCIRKLVPIDERRSGPASWDPQAPNQVCVHYFQAYQALMAEIRGQLHLASLEGLLPGATPAADGERVMLASVELPSSGANEPTPD